MMQYSTIEGLVAKGATERELQAALKNNPAILGNACQTKSGEYIVFSEFPVSHNRADFAVFFDRSRMNILLVEIKGADFYFLNRDRTLAHELDDAARAVRDHLYYVNSNYESFRREVHMVRKIVEDGTQKYNSVIGKRGYLEVDSDKDIQVRAMIIGGRTRDDLEESREKEKLARTALDINYESWDSWLRKYRSSDQF
jgi:hypothetical protein